jgi:hypothetical protein
MDLAILKTEEKKISDFLGKKIFLNQPNISSEDLEKFKRLGFELHFLPAIDVLENHQFTNWQQAPKSNFYNLVSKGILPKNTLTLSGKWILIDNRLKPVRCYPWIAKGDFLPILSQKIFRVNWFKICCHFDKQQYEQDYLLEILQKNGYASRFSLSWQKIDEIVRPAAADLLGIAREKIRLPRFIEWNFLANLFYPQWGESATWEWLNDRFKTGECLSSGCQGLAVLGWDPPDFWSTILGFRFLIEI